MNKNSNIPQPIKNGTAKVPVIMQYENLECGAVSLAMILGYYNKWIPAGEVRADTGPCRDGANAYHIAKAAESYGLSAEVKKCKAEEFFSCASFPCIVHWQYTHFLVVTGVKGDKVCINDPKKGSYSLSRKSFSQKYTGFCVFFAPSKDFVPEGHRKSLGDFIRERLTGTRDMLLFILLTTLLISVLTTINQGMSKVFLDRLVTGKNPDWVKPFFLLLAAVTLARILVDILQAVYMMRIKGKLSVTGSTSFMWHLMKLPLSFYAQRLPGDINFRKRLNVEVADKLVGTFGPLALQILMVLLYLVIMVRYSLILSIIGVSGILLNAVLGRVIARKRVNITREQMSNSGQMSGTLAAGIQMIETIKASGAENGFFELWSGYQSNVNNQHVKTAKLDQYLGMIPMLVSSLSSVAVLLTGAFLIMNGQFTPGALMAFQGFLTLFQRPAMDLIDAGKDLQQMRTNMERIDDVMECDEDIRWQRENERRAKEPAAGDRGRESGSAAQPAKEQYAKLSGQLSMKGISFGYSRLDPPLIEDFELELTPGKSVAFVGPSGCGKSTLTKLISGLYQPWSGSITFDGKPLLDIDNSVLRGSLAVVDQDIILFEDTIENNIKMWDDTIENFEMILAARDAQIHYDIMKREKGYQHQMLPEGKDFSGGERQRMEIARVLAQEPSIIILDEATSALDAKTEYEVVKAIKDRGITCIVIAHKLSTIRGCDEIIVLRHGHVAERGTHNELLRKDGLYAALVKSE